MMLEDQMTAEGSDMGYLIPLMQTLRSSSKEYISECVSHPAICVGIDAKSSSDIAERTQP
jgi:hypothetical protein